MMNEKLSNTARCVRTNLGRIPTLTVSGETNLPGNFCLSFISVPAIMQLDGKGNIDWTDEEPLTDNPMPLNLTISEGKEFPDSRGWWDFKKTIGTDGKTYYSYHAASEDGDDYSVSGYHPGKRVILDEKHVILKTLGLAADLDYGVKNDDYVDGHDFLMFTPDHYILSSYRSGKTDDGRNVVYSYLQEVENGAVVWRWASIDHSKLLDLTKSYTEVDGKDMTDYIHFNSMCLDRDNNLICSFRHINTIMKLDRTTKNCPMGSKIIWKLSGDKDEFGLTDDQKTCYQHFVRLESDKGITLEQNDNGASCCSGNTKLTCFDNQNAKRKTRLVSYEIDQNAKTCVTFTGKEIYKKYSSACGSVQYIGNGICVVGWGKAECELITNERECMTVYDFGEDGMKEEELMTIFLTSYHGFNFTYRCAYCE